MTPEVFSPGKVNLNRYPSTLGDNYLFLALFKGVRYAVDNFHDYEGTTGAVNDTEAIAMRDELGKPIDTRKRFLNRAALIAYRDGSRGLFNGFGAFSLNNDASKEALVGRITDLTSTVTTTPDTIQFVVVAQTIRDVGGDISLTLKKPDGTAVGQTVKFQQFDLKNEVYFDEITGEVKMLVTMKYDKDTKQLTLIHMEYID